MDVRPRRERRSLVLTPYNRHRKVAHGPATTATNGGRTATSILAVDTLGQLLAVVVTPAKEQERAQVAILAAQVQAVTGESVEVAFVDQGYTGEQPATDVHAHGRRLEVGKLPAGARL